MNLKLNKDTAYLHIPGRIDFIISIDMENYVRELLKDYSNFVIDFKDTEYISSSCIRVLIILISKIKNKGNLKICNLNQQCKKIFEITDLLDYFDINTCSSCNGDCLTER